MYRPVWIEVDLGAIAHNLEAIKAHVGQQTKVLATVKQAAYGHGLIPVARKLAEVGVDYFGVGSVEEAIELRQHGLQEPILVLTALLPECIPAIIEYRITPTVINFTFARQLNEYAQQNNVRVPVHIKIDTGMGRLGVSFDEAVAWVQQFQQFSNLFLEGIFTHFPAADTDPEFTQQQIDRFKMIGDIIARQSHELVYCHCANSAGLLQYPQARFSMVRPGIILYGIGPSVYPPFSLKPALSLKSRVVYVKTIKKGQGISYGRMYIAQQQTTIATVAIGYADGLPWSLSLNQAENFSRVIINDKYYPIAGRVCMDHIMVDCGSDANVEVGDEVILIGKSATKQIVAQDIADWANTIAYEIVSCLSERIPRTYRGVPEAQPAVPLD